MPPKSTVFLSPSKDNIMTSGNSLRIHQKMSEVGLRGPCGFRVFQSLGPSASLDFTYCSRHYDTCHSEDWKDSKEFSMETRANMKESMRAELRIKIISNCWVEQTNHRQFLLPRKQLFVHLYPMNPNWGWTLMWNLWNWSQTNFTRGSGFF